MAAASVGLASVIGPGILLSLFTEFALQACSDPLKSLLHKRQYCSSLLASLADVKHATPMSSPFFRSVRGLESAQDLDFVLY